MEVPTPRGPLTTVLVESLTTGRPAKAGLGRAAASADPASDDDLQLGLWMLYELHYRGFDGVSDAAEWRPDLLRVRAELEKVFEQQLRAETWEFTAALSQAGADFADSMFAAIEDYASPPLASFVHRKASHQQLCEVLVQRSIYQLKEADPHSWGISRLEGPAKVALVELLYDEYGAGRPERLHSRLFADTLAECGLDPTYGRYVDDVPAITLAVNNAMSMCGLHRRLTPALMGHLAAFEATSSLPARRYAGSLRRLGLGDRAAAYFDEHVEADAVHEQVAIRDICGRLVADDPTLLPDVAFGAGVCLLLDARAAEFTLQRWTSGASALRSAAADAEPQALGA